MRLLKILLVIFLIYFIRRFIQMYRVMKTIRENQEQKDATEAAQPEKAFERKKDSVIDADFKVVD